MVYMLTFWTSMTIYELIRIFCNYKIRVYGIYCYYSSIEVKRQIMELDIILITALNIILTAVLIPILFASPSKVIKFLTDYLFRQKKSKNTVNSIFKPSI